MLYDGEAFLRHRRSGISRFFSELISEYRRDPSLSVEPVTPYRYVANAHLASRRSGFVQIPLPHRVRYRVLRRLNARRIAAATGVDLVHHSLYESCALDTWVAPKRVCTVYDFTMELFPELFWDTSSELRDKRLFLDRCDVVTCISRTTYDDLRRFYPDLDKPVVVTLLGTAPAFFHPQEAAIRGLPERYLLHVGNRHKHKNADLLFRAFAELSRSDRTLHLVLSGQHLPDEAERLRDLGIADRTVLLKATDGQLPWLYHRASAFVFPSRYEGFGLPVVEAMAAGCPVVLANTPGLLEVAGDAALVFAPDDVDMLVRHLERLVNDSAMAAAMRERGSRRAAQFTWRRTAEATSAAYDLI